MRQKKVNFALGQIAATAADLEDTVRREALERYLDEDEEQALDLLTVARAMAEPTPR